MCASISRLHLSEIREIIISNLSQKISRKRRERVFLVQVAHEKYFAILWIRLQIKLNANFVILFRWRVIIKDSIARQLPLGRLQLNKLKKRSSNCRSRSAGI